MSEENPELQARLRELDHELEVGLRLVIISPFVLSFSTRCDDINLGVFTDVWGWIANRREI
jgi:hypothetical protein